MDYLTLKKKVNCIGCVNKDPKIPDVIDGEVCKYCKGKRFLIYSIFLIWRENRLREKYNFPRLERIT